MKSEKNDLEKFEEFLMNVIKSNAGVRTKIINVEKYISKLKKDLE